jgi:small subunit ribosomal protein S17
MTNTSTRGRTFTGIVTGDKMSKTVTVEWPRRIFIKKFERYQRRRSKVKAHNPTEIDARVGDKVLIMETRPLSKTKHFIVIKKLAVEGGAPVAHDERGSRPAPKKQGPAPVAAVKKAAPKKKPVKADKNEQSE